MCFKSAAEGQKAFRGRAASSVSLTARQESPNGRGTKASKSQGGGPELMRESQGSLDLDLNLNRRSEVRVEKVQAQSPTITRGARSWRSSAAETGPRLGCCRRRASLELEERERRIEEPVVVITNGTSCCCWSSMSSCSASCRFTAMALSAKNVRSLELLDLRDKIKNRLNTKFKYLKLKCP